MLCIEKCSPASLSNGLQDIVLEGSGVNDVFVCDLRGKMTCEEKKDILRNCSIDVKKMSKYFQKQFVKVKQP